MNKDVMASLLHGADVKINFEIGNEPRVGDAVSAIVPYGDGPRGARLVITNIAGGILTCRKPIDGGGGIELRVPRRFLNPDREGVEWHVSQTPEGLFKEIIQCPKA